MFNIFNILHEDRCIFFYLTHLVSERQQVQVKAFLLFSKRWRVHSILNSLTQRIPKSEKVNFRLLFPFYSWPSYLEVATFSNKKGYGCMHHSTIEIVKIKKQKKKVFFSFFHWLCGFYTVNQDFVVWRPYFDLSFECAVLF